MIGNSGAHHIEKEQYKWGWNDEREYLNALMMDRGLRAAIQQAVEDARKLKDATNPFEIGIRHSADQWVAETQWMEREEK